MKLNYPLIIGVALGGYLLYDYFTNKTSSATSLPSGSPTSLPVVPASASGDVPNNPAGSGPGGTGPVVSTSPTAMPAGNTIPSVVYQTIQKWANEDGRAPVKAMAAANQAAEYMGMYDLITNVWNKGLTPQNQGQIDFWDTLRNKYDPGDPVW